MSFTDYLIEPRPTEVIGARKSRGHGRHRQAEHIAISPGNILTERRFPMRFDAVQPAVFAQISEMNGEWMIEIRLVLGVASPISGHDIHAPISVEVSGGNAVPPSGQTA